MLRAMPTDMTTKATRTGTEVLWIYPTTSSVRAMPTFRRTCRAWMGTGVCCVCHEKAPAKLKASVEDVVEPRPTWVGSKSAATVVEPRVSTGETKPPKAMVVEMEMLNSMGLMVVRVKTAAAVEAVFLARVVAAARGTDAEAAVEPTPT